MHNEAMEKERPHKRTRKFDGMVFRLHNEEIMSKEAANYFADYWRNRGHLVRIVKEPKHSEYLIYMRRK